MNPDPTRSLAADPDTPPVDSSLAAGLAAAFGPDPAPTPPVQSEMPGSVGPRYVLGDEIARGGMGVVLRATDTAFGREVAVKVLADKFGPGSGAAHRFADEARITGRLQHPGIPPAHDLGTLPDGRPFLAMKLIRGETLDTRLAARPGPSADRGRFVAVFEGVCQAVAYAHSKGVIHRDLKPANVMVGAFGEVQVMDWGLAKDLASRERERPEGDDNPHADPERTGAYAADEPGRTGTGAVLGTPAYMPPEQARGEPADRRSDVFGLGAVLCAILTGRPPFGGSGESARRMAAAADLGGAFARLGGCGAEPEVVALCGRCLAPNPADRPADAGEVAAAVAGLRAAADDRARQAELDRAAAAAEAREQRKRRKVQLALAASVGLLLLGGGVAAWWQDRAEGRRRVTQVKVEAAEERARGAVETAITRAADLRSRYRYADARATLDQAAGLLPADAAAELRDRLVRARDDLAFVAELDRIRMKAVTWAPGPKLGQFDEASAPPAYRAAFLAHGLDVLAGDPAAVAGRVRNSTVRAELVAALDYWAALAEQDGPGRDRVLAVARLADPGDWQTRFRDPAVRIDKDKVAALAAVADAATLSPGTVVALDRLMFRHGLDSMPALKAAQFYHPTDFPIAITLGLRAKLDTPGKTGERAPYLRVARALRPDNGTVPSQLGFAYFLNDKKAGIAHLREGVRLAPDVGASHFMLVMMLEIGGDVDGAIVAAGEAVRILPADAYLWAALGTVLFRKGNLPEADAAVRESIRLDPGHAHPHYILGEIRTRTGDLDGAEAAYREAIRLQPKDATMHNCLATVLTRKMDPDGAERAYREVLRLDPNHVEAQFNFGRILRQQARFAEALPLLKRGHELGSKQPGWPHPSARWVADCERELAAQEARTAPPPREVRR